LTLYIPLNISILNFDHRMNIIHFKFIDRYEKYT